MRYVGAVAVVSGVVLCACSGGVGAGRGTVGGRGRRRRVGQGAKKPGMTVG